MKKIKKNKAKSSTFWLIFSKNKLAVGGLVVLILFILMAIFANVIAPYDSAKQDLLYAKQGPSMTHWLGTDEFGRDILSRIIYGARQSLFIGFAAVFIAMITGSLLGLIAGYYGKAIDSVIMRIMDILMAIPSMLLAIAIVAALGAGIGNLLLAIAIASIPSYARVMRASVMSVKEQDYIMAARSVGVGTVRILFEDILPNCLSPIIVQSTIGVAFAILTTASLSYLGLGVQPPTAEWGQMISTAKDFMRDYPYMILAPGISIMLTILSLNLVGDGLRDALDPKLRY